MMFEWDENKNQSNIAKHGVSFEEAQKIFNSPVLSMIDNREEYGETREISIGIIGYTVILTVVHTDREGNCRIISARKSKKKEREKYEKAIRAGIIS